MPDREDLPTSEAADPAVGLLLSVLKLTTLEWRKQLDGLAEAAVVWQPYANAHSIGALILHIADVEAWWLHEVGAGIHRSPEELKELLSEETQQYAGIWPVPPAQPLAWYYAQHDRVRERTCDLLQTMDIRRVAGEGEDVEFTLRWLLGHVIAHEAYHGGQAALLSVMYEKQAAGS